MGRFFVFLSLLAPALAFADPTPVVPGGDPLACFTQLDGTGKGLSSSTGTVSGMPFTKTLRLKTGSIPAGTNAWDMRARCFSTAAAAKNDTLLATFWMRALSAPEGKGYTTFVLEQNVSPYTKSVSFTAVAGSDWKKIEIPFSMAESYPANGYNLSFWAVFPNQEIEIGGLAITDYGLDYEYSQLRLANWPYEGHAPDAPWRAAAAARIEKYRMGDIAVVAKDDAGNPIPGAQVRVKMKRHAFGFGTAVAGDILQANTADGQKYRDTLKKYFNKVVTENALKWEPWVSGWGRSQADYMLPWFAQNGFTAVRGHNMVWPGKQFLPGPIVSLIDARDAAGLRAATDDHIREIGAYARGKVTEWDVINEPYANHDIQDVLGNGDAAMAGWFKLARSVDPDAKLYVNDYNILEAGGADMAHIDGFYGIVQRLIENGAPVDGIGLQSHFDTNLTSPDRVLELLDKFAAFGKDLQVTEFDVNIRDDQAQADYTRDFLTTTFSHPAVNGFMLWGFWEKAHWLPDGAMFRADWSTKPMFDAWNDLIYRQWWTDTTGTTDADGVFRTRGFLGEYDIEVTAPGKPTATYSRTVASHEQPLYLQTGKAAAGAITAAGIGSAASYQSGAVAPGELLVIYGSDIGPATLTSARYGDDLHLPTTVADTQVLFDGRPGPMVYASAGQTAAIAPYGVKDTTKIQVVYQGVPSNEATLPVVATLPGIFMCNDGSPVLFNFGTSETSRVPCRESYVPPKPGAAVTLFVTGEGAVDPPIADGQYPGTTYPKPVRPLKVTFDGVEAQPCEASFVGMIFAGVTQVNACVPAGVDGTAVQLKVDVGGAESKPVATPVGWRLLWHDEFDGAEGALPDSSKWGYDLGAGGWGNAELETYTNKAENASTDGKGHLAIRALNNNGQYTSARLKTQGKFDFTYGKVEVRAKVPYGKGIWPAIWMLGNDIGTVGWPRCGEIDIMEYIGAKDPATIYGTVHGPTATGAHTSAGSSIAAAEGQSWYDDFHVYALEWTADTVRILVDGKKYLEVPSNPPPNGLQWVYQHPYFLILNVAVGGNWPGYPDASTTFPATMLVDYVRVYQRQ